jgi:hypothetical protein
MKHTPTDAEIAVFVTRVNRRGPLLVPKLGRCWVWTGSLYANGYGRFWWRSKHIRAHRFAYIIWIDDELPADLNVLHRCDNPPCVRPKHIYGGDKQDNSDDMWERERGALGFDFPYTKLSDDDVRYIRARHELSESRGPGIKGTASKLAEQFGVHPNTIRRIWKSQRRKRV